MIQYKDGDLLSCDAEALVNAVNCVGIMGKGLALQFKRAFPENFKRYKAACSADAVVLGQMFVCDLNGVRNPQLIINFSTKKHWKSRSRIEDIESGLAALIEEIKSRDIKSVALPALGCGLGGLEWESVRPLIESAALVLPEVKFHVYAPPAAVTS